MSCLFFLLLLAPADLPKDVPQYLQDISVTIKAGRAEGSGVIKTTKDGAVWIWTAGHVIEDLRRVRKVISAGSEKSLVEFDDPKVLKILVEDGRKVGEYLLDAEVIRYSNADHGEDLALLRLRSRKFQPASSAIFYIDDKIPSIGTDLYHCGSLRGQFGSNSLTTGIVSQLGRVLEGRVYDQTTCPAEPGSSGGGVYLRDGRYVGTLVRGSSSTFNLCVPVRRLRDWAKRTGVEFALNDTLPVPSDEKLRGQPVEDRPVLPGEKEMLPAKAFPQLILRKD